MLLKRLKWPLRIFAGLIALVVLLAIVAYFNRVRILVALMKNDAFVEWAGTFEPGENYTASLQGSYPVAACQNSHVDFGEAVRRTVSLDGVWDVEEGPLSDTAPEAFAHRAPVPGLITEATPSFSEMGKKSKQRDVFWYRTRFNAPNTPSAQAHICLHKAAYGVKVWLNGQELGEHFGPFTLSEYDASTAIKYGGENELIVRLGADRSQLPDFVPAGDDDEVARWYPGLWDSVSLVMTGDASIANVKVETDVDTGQVTVITELHNSSDTAFSARVSQSAASWPVSQEFVPQISDEVTLAPGSNTSLTQTFTIEDAKLWSPETPHLYLVSTRVETANADGQWVATDDRATRFGMRKAEWRSGDDKGFYLNNRKYYLRGTNVALHRFFGDAERQTLPWNEDWVRELLSGHPKDFHWNSIRTHNGRVPNFWYDIADEAGLIIADEYSFWSVARGTESADWSIVELEKEFRGWVRESWNHPSIGWWDAANENNNPMSTEVIARVRSIDPTRQWENGGYQRPEGPNDPIEEHPYKLNSGGALNLNDRAYTLDDFSTMDGQPPQAVWGLFATYADAPEHPFINNEYAFLWITQLGRPTPLAQSAFDTMTGGLDLSPDEYREAYAYVTSELTAYWRAMRGYAGVQHFVYLSKCNDEDLLPDAWEIRTTSATCDSFLDVTNLELEPRWERYAKDVFAPQLVYLKEWRDQAYPRGQDVDVPLILINDDYEAVAGNVRLYVTDAAGNVSSSDILPVTIPPLGRVELNAPLNIPDLDAFTVYAKLSSQTEAFAPVWSRRKIGFEHPGVQIQDPPFE